MSSPNVTILPLLKGYKLCKADAVNQKRWIVGEMDTFVGSYGRQASRTHAARGWMGSLQSGPAVLWLNHTVYNLNRLIPQHSGWHLLQATGINATGQIVGNGMYKGRQTAFLLTPR